MLITYLGNKITSDQKLQIQVKVLHGKYTSRFTCALTTRWVFLCCGSLGMLLSAPGQQPCLTSQDPEPTLRTSIWGRDNRADHTAGARYVQRAQNTSYLDQNLSYNSGRSLQVAALPPYWAPLPAPTKGSPVRHLGQAPSCPTAGKNYLLCLTAQGQPYNPGFPYFFQVLFPLHFWNLCPEKAPLWRSRSLHLIAWPVSDQSLGLTTEATGCPGQLWTCTPQSSCLTD